MVSVVSVIGIAVIGVAIIGIAIVGIAIVSKAVVAIASVSCVPVVGSLVNSHDWAGACPGRDSQASAVEDFQAAHGASHLLLGRSARC